MRNDATPWIWVIWVVRLGRGKCSNYKYPNGNRRWGQSYFERRPAAEPSFCVIASWHFAAKMRASLNPWLVDK